jgi:ESCRT-II complex subunit VPS25|tara:strand:+ start:39 stop:344 length:306 start_codon:yes stop_codon:yes gene_type:complete
MESLNAEQLRSFRPFYSLQPVLETRQRQLAAWMEVILEWSRSSRVSAVAVGEFPLFVNAEIERKLDDAAARAVLDHLAANGACVVALLDAARLSSAAVNAS